MKHEFPVPPMEHQVEGMRQAWRHSQFAWFWEMGTGKTFATIQLAVARYNLEQIEALIVICPTPIKLVWESELEKWCRADYSLHVHGAGTAKKKQLREFIDGYPGGMKVLVVGVESLSQGDSWKMYIEFAMKHKCMAVADESSRLKNAQASRTKRAITIASHSDFRLALTGTPITQGIHDLFGQFQFLDPAIIGLRSFTQFKARYCLMGGFENRNIVGYQNQEHLMQLVKPYSHVVKKEDVLDLPPKTFERIIVEPSKEQLAVIEQLKDTEEAEHAGEFLLTETVLERLTRFQQIIGGHFPFNVEGGAYDVKPMEGPNPKLNALIETLSDIPEHRKVIIWTRFKPEGRLISNTLIEIYGEKAVTTFMGDNSEDERKENVKNFQTGLARFMISSPQLGGMGQTWTAATVVIYYSNSFSYEDRMQSEDRAHRKGQEHPVLYIDIEAAHRYDRMILAAIRAKQDMAQYVDKELRND